MSADTGGGVADADDGYTSLRVLSGWRVSYDAAIDCDDCTCLAEESADTAPSWDVDGLEVAPATYWDDVSGYYGADYWDA